MADAETKRRRSSVDDQVSAREFGRLEGKVDSLDNRMSEFQRQSSAEHVQVSEKIDGLGARLERLLERHDERIDSLEATRDQGKGKAAAVKIAEGIAFFLFALAGFIFAIGGHIG